MQLFGAVVASLQPSLLLRLAQLLLFLAAALAAVVIQGPGGRGQQGVADTVLDIAKVFLLLKSFLLLSEVFKISGSKIRWFVTALPAQVAPPPGGSSRA